jgi:hypothetical protein
MTPYSLGVSQADAAIKASQNLSAQLAAIIYYDMEPYTATAGDACSTEVRQFMQGWVTELKLKGFKAGAYGNVWAAANDYSTLAAAPNSIDDVYVTNPTPTNVSIWSLASGSKKLGTYVALCDPFSVIPCTNWNSQQRIHQYALDTKIIYGSSPELGVDIDLVNADVAVSSTTTAAKPLVYNYFDLEIAGALVTQPTGISDSGAVVGYTASTSGNGFLFSIDQYTLPIDQYTFIGCPGAVETVPWAVNDAGRIVGEYISSSGPVEFIYSKGKCPTIPLQPPAALNDSGLIVGSGGIAQFYIKNQNTGKTSAVPCSRCVVYGIDGDAYIVGTTNPNQTVIPTSFLYDPVAGSFTTFSGPPLFSVNANLQLLSGQALYDYATKTSTPIQYPQAFANESGAAAINDYAEIVGAWTDSTGGTHGFLACPEGDPNCPAQ